MASSATTTVVTAPDPADAYTILRVKRKRNEEPLDALVFNDHTRKRTKDSKARAPADAAAAPPVSVFQFAETVETKAWKDEFTHKKLQERITVLLSKPEDAAKLGESSVSRSDVVAGKRPSRSQSPTKPRKFMIVENSSNSGRTRVDSEPTKYLSVPPKVIPAVTATRRSQFNLYDAVPSTPTRNPSTEKVAPAVDAEMEQFLPMLRDYLKLSDIELAPAPEMSRPPIKATGSEQDDTATRIAAEDEDDYVWDVYYYRPTLTQWNTLAMGGNVGSLTGLPPSINDPNDSDSDSEPEDEDDEDSNAEDYYKNEYPEEESDYLSSDEFHEDSDYDDFLKDEMDDADDHDWR